VIAACHAAVRQRATACRFLDNCITATASLQLRYWSFQHSRITDALTHRTATRHASNKKAEWRLAHSALCLDWPPKALRLKDFEAFKRFEGFEGFEGFKGFKDFKRRGR
jgi:hypothetical protein